MVGRMVDLWWQKCDFAFRLYLYHVNLYFYHPWWRRSVFFSEEIICGRKMAFSHSILYFYHVGSSPSRSQRRMWMNLQRETQAWILFFSELCWNHHKLFAGCARFFRELKRLNSNIQIPSKNKVVGKIYKHPDGHFAKIAYHPVWFPK